MVANSYFQIFNRFDENGDRRISKEESSRFRTECLEEFGLDVVDNEFFESKYEEAFEQADIDGSGTLDIEEFAMVFAHICVCNSIVPSVYEDNLSI